VSQWKFAHSARVGIVSDQSAATGANQRFVKIICVAHIIALACQHSILCRLEYEEIRSCIQCSVHHFGRYHGLFASLTYPDSGSHPGI